MQIPLFQRPLLKISDPRAGGEKDKKKEAANMPRHEKHPPFRWVSTWGIFYCKTGDFFLRFLTQPSVPTRSPKGPNLEKIQDLENFKRD